jgi:hypothetical protein
MAPEQANSASIVDIRADLYALGITMWEMLTGEDYKTLAVQAREPDLRQYNPTTSNSIVRVIEKSLRADPVQRYATPQLMTQDLQAVRDGRQPLAVTERIQPVPTIRVSQPQQRTRNPLTLIFLPVALLGAVIFVLYILLGRGGFDGGEAANATPIPSLTASATDTSSLLVGASAQATPTEPIAVSSEAATASATASATPRPTPSPATTASPTNTLLPATSTPTATSVEPSATQPPPSPTADSTQRSTIATPTGLTNEELIGSGVSLQELSESGGLRIVMLGPEGQPWEGAYIEIYEQTADVTGNPTRSGRVRDGRINQQGQLDLELGQGAYIICTGVARGYSWSGRDCIYDVSVNPGKLTVVQLQVGQIEVAIVGATGEPWESVYFQVFTQKQDVSGNQVIDSRAVDGRTANTGLGSSWLTPGLYSVAIDLRGYNWGAMREAKGEANVAVERGKIVRLTIEMGRLVLGLKRPNGEPATGVYAEVFTQKADISGNAILDARVWEGRTDNAGFASVDLTQGEYAIKIGEQILFGVPIAWGRVTVSDGQTATQE